MAAAAQPRLGSPGQRPRALSIPRAGPCRLMEPDEHPTFSGA
jgi:hypothetical protein